MQYNVNVNNITKKTVIEYNYNSDINLLKYKHKIYLLNFLYGKIHLNNNI